MDFTFGKHNGKSVTKVMIDDPSYITWCLEKPIDKPALLSHIRKAIKGFDSKPFLKRCDGYRECGNTATRATLYSSHSGYSTTLYFWCDSCDPYSSGAASNATLSVVRGYHDVLRWAESYNVRKTDCREIVRCLATAKGAGAKLTKVALSKLFGV